MSDIFEYIDNFLYSINFTKEQVELTKDILIVAVPLTITAILFFLGGLFFKSKKKKKNVESESENNVKELQDYKEKFIELYKVTQGKKVSKVSIQESIDTDDTDDFENDIEQEEETVQINNSNQDDLTQIEGINSKIQYILRINSIDSYQKLADTNQETLQFLLDKYGGSSYKIYNPENWNNKAKELINKDK
ncbi:MAG: hypothetical protein H6604_05070 [Flavobacteriales bacterium]|nr:hypothetical protein [Flavobacteriales bacterium]